MSEPVVLSFDTSSARCVVAVLAGDRVLVDLREEMARGQAERLMPLIEEGLAQAATALRRVAVIGVGIGPGNFTGIRISVAAARGLSLALGVPAVGVSVLEAMALGAGDVLVCQHARGGQIHAQRFGTSPKGPSVQAPDSLGAAWAAPSVIGDAAGQIADRLGAQVLPAPPLAPAIGRIALARRSDPGPRPAPLYLGAAEAAPSRHKGPVILPC